MRQYYCECQECGEKNRVVIKNPPYPGLDEVFMWKCPKCDKETGHVRIAPDKQESTQSHT